MLKAERAAERAPARIVDAQQRRVSGLLDDHDRDLEILSAHFAIAEELQRRHIAEALHDEVGQDLAALRFRLSSLCRTTPEDESADTMRELVSIVDRIIRSTRSLVFSLGSPALHALGLSAALERLVDEVRAEHGIDARLQGCLSEAPLGEDLGVVLHRSVRELLRNVAKHARARRVWVTAEQSGDWVEIVVEDDGVGCARDPLRLPLDSNGGFGLFSIDRSLRHAGGSMTIEPRPGGGTRVRLRAPVAA